MTADGLAPNNLFTRRSIGAALCYASYIYAAGLVGLLAGLEWVGEKNWLLSICLYLPIQIWLLPLLLLTPASLVYRRSLCFLHCGLVLLVMGLFGQYHLGSAPVPKTAQSLTVVTNNIGQSNHQSMHPFLEAEQPDLLALQDAANRGPAYTREYPDRFVVGRGEFLLVSKYPVLSADLVPEPVWNREPVAARFELSFKGSPLVVYSVHMPTPRPDFFKLRRLGILRELLGHNRRRSDGRSYAESMRARVALAGELAGVFGCETKPFIVVGDFNMPNHGSAYHLMEGTMEDAFKQVGSGYGYSFPGVTNRILMLLGPWLRLDYLFAGHGWSPVYCRVEPDRASQHRAVVARFEPKPIEK